MITLLVVPDTRGKAGQPFIKGRHYEQKITFTYTHA